MKPSTRICLQGEFENAVFFKAVCSCGCEQCDQTIEIGEEDDEMIYARIYAKIVTNSFYRYEHKWYKRWFEVIKEPFRRIKYAVKFLTVGYLEGETSILFEGKEQIECYIGAFQYALDKINRKPSTELGATDEAN